MVIINVDGKHSRVPKTSQIDRQLSSTSNEFTTLIQDRYNKYIATVISNNLNNSWDMLLKSINPQQIKGIIYQALKELWSKGWSLGSEHGRDELADVYNKIKRVNFANNVELVTFANNNEKRIESLRKQIQALVYQQEDNETKLQQLNKDILNPNRYAKKRLNKSSLTDDERNTVVNILSNQADTIKQQQNQLKQQQDALIYQLTKVASGETSPAPKQLDMLSNEEVKQIRAERRAEKQNARRTLAQQKAEQRQQDLLAPITSTSSPLSKVVSDLREQRIRESKLTREVSRRLKTPITLANETEFGKYLDQRYNNLASKLAKDTTEGTNKNIKNYINQVGNSKSKISNYLASTKTSRERDLVAALSALYPDYGKEARKIIKETKSQLLSSRDITAINQNIQQLQRSIQAYRSVNNSKKVAQLEQELRREQSKLVTNIRLNSEQARRLGLEEKATTISREELDRIANQTSTLPQIKRLGTTELSAAYNYGRYAHYIEDGIKLVRWNVSLEHLRMNSMRSKNATNHGVICGVCWDLSKRNIGYGEGVYPLRLFISGQMLPPPNPHPNCACYLEPVDGQDDDRDKKVAGLIVPKLARNAILGGATIASIALLNTMFNRTRGAVRLPDLYELVNTISKPVRNKIQAENVGQVIQNISEVYEFTELLSENANRIKLEAPPIISDNIQVNNEADRELANQILVELENPIKTTPSKYDVTSTIRGRNSQVLNQASRAIGNDINALNKAQQLVRESENKRREFEVRFASAEGNPKLQNILLNEYTQYVNRVTKAITDLDVSQIKLINTLNATRTALEETRETMARYRVAEEISPGIATTSNLVDNTNTVKRLTDQANTVYQNIINTQELRQEYRSTLNTAKNSLLNNPAVANKYLEQKAKELNFIDTIFEPTKGRITLTTNLDTAQEYIDAVKERITNKTTTNPVEYDQSIKDILAAQEQLDQIRNATKDVNLDFDLLSNATQDPTVYINNQPNTLPFSQEQVTRVQSKFTTLSRLETEAINLQAELRQLRANSPKAKDQLTLNPRGLEKASRLNELTRQMGSLIYEQQGLLSSNPRYNEINQLLRELNQQKQEIETAYFKRNIVTLNPSVIKKRITINGYKK